LESIPDFFRNKITNFRIMITAADQSILGGLEGAFPGISTASQEQLLELSKALEATQLSGLQTLNSTTASGGPLKVESLEKTLKVLAYRESSLRFYKRINTSKAYNTVEEYVQQTSYAGDGGSFTLEGELPQSNDPTYVRRSQLVKYLGDTRAVTHQMTLVNTAFDSAMQQQIKSGTMNIMRAINRGMPFADSTLVPEEFNGFLAQQQQADVYATFNDYMNSTEVIDLRGASLTEAVVEQAAEQVVENFGVGTELFLPPSVHSKFATSLYSSKRFVGNTPNDFNNIGAGARVNAFTSQFGDIGLTYDVHMNGYFSTKTTTSTATSPNAPAVPVADGTNPVTPVAATVTNTKWGASDAGTYFYAVTARNRFGESALTVLNGSIATIVTNGAVDLKFTAGSGTYPATSYVIYRSNKGASSAAAAKFYPLFGVSLSQLASGYDGAAALSVRDLNRFMPGMKQAFLLENTDEVVTLRQLAPLMKMDLAIVSPAFRFMILAYVTPILYAPKKMIRFINVLG
jgi:hypothetical protein